MAQCLIICWEHGNIILIRCIDRGTKELPAAYRLGVNIRPRPP